MDVVEGKVHLVCDIEPVSNVGIAMGKTPDAALKSARDYRAFVLAERGGVV